MYRAIIDGQHKEYEFIGSFEWELESSKASEVIVYEGGLPLDLENMWVDRFIIDENSDILHLCFINCRVEKLITKKAIERLDIQNSVVNNIETNNFVEILLLNKYQIYFLENIEATDTFINY